MRNYIRKSQRNVDNVLNALGESEAIVSDKVKVAFEKVVTFLDWGKWVTLFHIVEI